MADSSPYVVKQILKVYNMDSLAFAHKKRGYVSITVHVIFTPKEESSISPKSVRCFGVVNYYKKGRKLEEMILPSEREMPILSYINDNLSFYDFVEEFIIKKADEECVRLYG